MTDTVVLNVIDINGSSDVDISIIGCMGASIVQYT